MMYLHLDFLMICYYEFEDLIPLSIATFCGLENARCHPYSRFSIMRSGIFSSNDTSPRLLRPWVYTSLYVDDSIGT
jgi:hypothetical protein